MKWIRLFLVILTAYFSQAANAQTFPSGTVRLVVPYAAGGGVDAMARLLAERLSGVWGKQVIVENKPGAGTIIGTDYVAKAPPDGLTLLVTTDSSITSNPHLYRKLPFDPMKDLVPVTQLVDLYQMIVVPDSVKADTLKEFVALAKSDPQPMSYGSYGAGSQPNLLFEALKLEAGIPLTHVPYKGMMPAIQATLSNEVQITLGGSKTTGQFFVAGGRRLKPLALSAPQRFQDAPQVPTLKEAGFPDLEFRAWFGMLAPRGTPQPVVDKISHDVAQILADPEFEKVQITDKGLRRVGSTPAQFAEYIRTDYEQKKKIIERLGIKIE